MPARTVDVERTGRHDQVNWAQRLSCGFVGYAEHRRGTTYLAVYQPNRHTATFSGLSDIWIKTI
ncbi:MAG: hypothetical protein GY806_22565 [Gammaproteobacteria bacterium]|nr:hypothetical protein [Gammaproteobacteria bacterium]